MELDGSAKVSENNSNIEENIDPANNCKLNIINAADAEPSVGSENEDSRIADKETVVEEEEQIQLEKKGEVDKNETNENLVNENVDENEKTQDDETGKTQESYDGETQNEVEKTQDDEVEKTQDDDVEKTQDDEVEKTQDDEVEKTQDDEKEKTKYDETEKTKHNETEKTEHNNETEKTKPNETEKSSYVDKEKSHNEETKNSEDQQNEECKNSQDEQNEKSQGEKATELANGVSEDTTNVEKDDSSKIEADENEDDDDDDDFNPLLLCPDISMDVEESPVLTGTSEPSQVNDAADSNSLFEPLFSTFVDEMTGAEISFNLTAEEQQLREKLYGPNNPIQFSKIHCTACNVHLGSALAGQTNRFVHPLLKVLICKECYHFYTSGEFEKDEDGSELYCRWCGQGGQVLCCTMCEFVFCKKCIRINFGRKKLTQVRDSDEWNCFRCDMSQLKTLRAMCVEFFEYIRRETARAATYSDSDTVNKDLTNCCQPQSKKRQLDTEKETEKEVVKRPKRRKNEDEDPDYNPYAQQSEDPSDSPVPSTSGIKSAAIVTKPTVVLPKTTAARGEVSFPGQSPSSTVRIGNQVLNVKSTGKPSQVATHTPPVVKNTAIRTPVPSTNTRVKPQFTPRTPAQTTSLRPAVGSLAHVRATAASKPQNLPTPVMKHEWFEKTVRAAARVNSNLSYTLTQLNKAQSSASSVEQLAVVHNKLQEILSSSINSLIQIRKNLRTEFIAGIKTIRFPPKPIVDPNDDDVIIVNPEPGTTLNNTRNIKGIVPAPIKTTTPVTPNRVSNNNSVSSSTPYLKVRSFQQLQTVSSECITIPDDDPPPSSTNKEPVIVDVIEESDNEKIPIGTVSKDDVANNSEDISAVKENSKKNESKDSEKVASEDNFNNKSTTVVGEKSVDKSQTEQSENDINEICPQNVEKDDEKNRQSQKRKLENDEVSLSEKDSNEAASNASKICNGDVTDAEVIVKTEPNDESYNIKDQPTAKIRRMLSVKVNLKKTPIVENMVKQEPIENGDN